ncbi:cbb3-type cytochrome c oxidase subunit I [Hydrogenobacter thermophilus]|uniref:cbb3-type cytochrome c oxidase subunit I n=1 Tax=Hydrogenobacter thermophilus TaxID=940 RepID=UPI0030F9AE02
MSLKRLTFLWILTTLSVFLFAIFMGILMRLNQANLIELAPNIFYSLMSAHGLLMAGVWFVMSMAGVNYLMSKYTDPPILTNAFAYVMTLSGALLLIFSLLLGGEHPGWYFLYPLPFYTKGAGWSLPLFILSLTFLGLGWFVWSLAMLFSILRKYSLSSALAWSALFGKKSDTPPFILITTVTLIGVIACLIAGVILLILFYLQYFFGVKSDALLAKNLTFLFGHTLVNEMLYFGIATLYELFPLLVGKPPYKIKGYVALAWNAVLLIVLLAYFHHLYMDFVQPLPFQFIGQIASWVAPIPAAAVTIFTVLTTVYGSGLRWNLAMSLFFLGTLFWAIGGIGAILDATIMNNFVLHNTLWVPAHFHTYNLLGNVLFSLAFITWFIRENAGEFSPPKLLLPMYIVGGTGFVFMFYLGGAFSVMRRVDKYPDFIHVGPTLAFWGAGFALLVFISSAIFLIYSLGKSLKIMRE